MLTISQAAAEHLTAVLEQRHADLCLEIAEERERAYTEGYSQLMEQEGDEGDHAFARAHLSVESRLIDRHLTEMHELEEALRRLRDGSYGLCIGCGGEIERARLRANPSAIRCMACQTRHERRSGH